MPDNKNKKQKSDIYQKVRLRKYVRMYLAPIAAVIIFLGIIIFLVVPKLSEVFTNLENVAKYDELLNTRTKEVSELQNLAGRSNLMLAQLKVLDETTPTATTEVVKFRDKVTEMTQENGLNIASQRISENVLNPATDIDPTQFGNFSLQEIIFLYEINGSYQAMTDFIDDLSVIDDFIIIREMELKGDSDGDSDNWNLKLRIDKYQFKVKDETDLETLYLSVPINVPISEKVLEYVNARL